MAFETGIRGMMTGASGLLWRIPTEILSRNETLDLNLKLKRARQAWRQRIFLNKFYLRLGSQRPNRIRKSAITIITTVKKKVSSFLISSRFKRASLVAYRFSIDVCAWHYRGRRSGIIPIQARPIHVDPIHVPRFMSERFMSDPIHVWPLSCPPGSIHVWTYSCPNWFMSDPFHVWPLSCPPGPIHVRPCSFPTPFMS